MPRFFSSLVSLSKTDRRLRHCAMRLLTLTMLLVMSGTLTACFKSERPLFSHENAVTPLPDEWVAALVGLDGRLQRESTGNPSAISVFQREGRTYRSSTNEVVSFLRPFDDQSLYLIQFQTLGGQRPKTDYVAGRISNGHLEIIAFNTTQDIINLMPVVRGSISRDGNDWLFTHPDDLLVLARASLRNQRDIALRYRLVTTEAQAEALMREVGPGTKPPAR